MSRRGLTRRELLAACGLGWLARSTPSFALAPPAVPDLPRVGRMARRALAAWRRSPGRFSRHGGGAVCDLGPAGRLSVERVGEGAARILLAAAEGELEILRPLAAPGVARVEARLANGPSGQRRAAYDTLRRVPGGVELTFSSQLALRHAAPRFFAAELPPVYEELAARALQAAGPLVT